MSRSSVAIPRSAGCLVVLFAVVSPRFVEAETICGDGVVGGEEACDAGGENGGTSCGCQVDCTFSPDGTACGSPEDTDCDNPDLCDGEGLCQRNQESDDTPCTSDTLFCTGLESCFDGLCSSAGNPCDPNVEVCDEETDQCVDSDLIFEDGFESGDFYAWDSVT